MLKISIKKNKYEVIDWFERIPLVMLMVALININAFRTFFYSRSNQIISITFALIIVVGTIRILLKYHGAISINSRVTIILLLTILYCLGTLALNSEITESLPKFILGLCTAYLASIINDEDLHKIFKLSTLFCTIYALYIIVNKSTIYANLLVTGKLNYLFVTLPIGLGLSFSLTYLILGKQVVWKKIYYLACSIIQFVSMLNYSARGNLIFPIILIFILMFITSNRDYKHFARNVFIMIILLLVAIYLFQTFANARLIERMNGFRFNYSSETRLPIYRKYLNYILSSFRVFIGHGFGSSSLILSHVGIDGLYPHNFILQLFGELGLLGLALVIICTIETIGTDVQWYREIAHEKDNRFLVFCLINAGLLFYLFTYLKSYSIYSGYQFFIFISLIINKNNRV